ncbi:MAG TPA: suppressor of fused domain protein [Kofleriaceae bacterium]
MSPAAECSEVRRSAIENYVAHHLGPAEQVLHEITSELVHIDIHIVRPTEKQPYWFLFTTGMSAAPMRVPDGHGLHPHAELSIMLPPWWVVDPLKWKTDPHWYWPIRELSTIARYPHRHRTWLGLGHTLAGSATPSRIDPSTKFASMVVLPTMLDGSEDKMIDADVPIDLFALWPLYADELDYKLAHGLHALLARLDEHRVTSVLDPNRTSCIAASSYAQSPAR